MKKIDQGFLFSERLISGHSRSHNWSFWVLIVLVVLTLLFIFKDREARASTQENEDGVLQVEWPYAPIEPLCPDPYPECLALDFELELRRAHMYYADLSPLGCRPSSSDRRRAIEDWELLAINVIGSGAVGKHYLDLLDTDGGAHGFAHFQPPNDLDIPELEEFDHQDYEDVECFPVETRWIDDEHWTEAVENILYSPQSVAIQLRAWRGEVNRAVRTARSRGWDREELVVAAVLANSTGQTGFINLAENSAWDPQRVIDAYCAQRPDSLHRRRRARRLERHL